MAQRPIDTDISFNVAHLLKGPVGGSMRVHVALPRLELGEERVARDVAGNLKVTRLNRGLLVTGPVTATVTLTCMRCLEEYDQPISFELEDEFRPTIDMASGTVVSYRGVDADGDYFLIGEDHVLDVSEALRQAAWLAIPMVPRCREDCPGVAIDTVTVIDGATDTAIDDRFSVLGQLLERDPKRATPPPDR